MLFRSLIERIRHYTQYSTSPYRNFDYHFVSFYGTTWGGKAGVAEREIRALMLEATRMPYDPGMQLVVALCVAQYDAFIANVPWDQQSRDKQRVYELMRRAATLSRTNPREGLDQTLQNAVSYMTQYPGYAGL